MSFNKAIVPFAVGLVLLLLQQLGITEDMSVKDAVAALATSALVYLVPNKKV